MAESKIEWTDATWNPVAGCTWASPGCDVCYAATMTRRLEAMGKADYTGLTTKKHFNGVVRTLPHKLDAPLRWKKPRMVFVNSMSDLFHKDVPTEFIWQVFCAMQQAPRHTFQILTKRPERMAGVVAEMYAASCSDPLPNVWLGTSVENQAMADERIPHLLDCPAAVRFLSCEPLLGPVELTRYDVDGRYMPRLPVKLDWVIVGGESGHGARPMHPDWARSLHDQCQAAGVPFFFKQWGEWIEGDAVPGGDLGGDFRRGVANILAADGSANDGHFRRARGDVIIRRVGKKNAGRLLDGREWNEYPRSTRPAKV